MFPLLLRTLRKATINAAGLSHRCLSQQKMALDLEATRIVWVDLEMTGLNVDTDSILEIACIVTDSELNIIAEGPNIIIQTPEEKLAAMNEWCLKQHAKSGLIDAAKTSTINLEEAEKRVLQFVADYVTEKQSPLAGNSIYMDRLFISKYMPTLNDYLHYRIIDTSTIKELCRRWNNNLFKQCPKKEFSHRSLNDIKESITELKFYKDHFFKVQQSSSSS